jgi:hypothetical protein
MKIFILAIVIAFNINAKEKDSDCIKKLNICRANCYKQSDPTGECILNCYKEADKCKY